MRTTFRPTAIILVLLLLAMPLTAAAPPTSGENLTISTNENWGEDAAMNGHVTVANGSTLTVSANITMGMDSSITVEEGGNLIVTNGALLSNGLNSGIRVNDFLATVSLNFGDIGQEGIVQLKFDHSIPIDTLFNITLGDTTVNASTSMQASGTTIIEFDANFSGENLVISFDSYYFTPTYLLWAKAIYGGGTIITQIAPEITNTSNAPLYWFQSGYDIIAHGSLSVISSQINGANITCEGLCNIEGSMLSGSAPISAATTATVTVSDATITGSRSDEDIILHDEASITYTNSQGTGGSTDGWIRLLSERVLQTNIPNGSLDITDLGYGKSDWNALTDSTGRVTLVSNDPTTEHKRIVEWMNGNGIVQQERGTITLSIGSSSSWGSYSTTVDAPATAFGTIDLPLPYLEVTTIQPEDITATVNRSIGAMVTVSNTGDVDTTANFRCYVDGNDADTKPSTLTATVAAGESKDIPIVWYMYKEGMQSLNCKAFLPATFSEIGDMVADLNGTTSDEVNWVYAEEIEETPYIIYIVAVLAFMGVALVAQRGVNKTYDEVPELPDDDEEEDEDEASEESPELEEKEEPEETEEPSEESPELEEKEDPEETEEPSDSIYDLVDESETEESEEEESEEDTD